MTQLQSQDTSGTATATIQDIQIQGDGVARIQLGKPIGFEATTNAALMAAARDPIFQNDVSYYVSGCRLSASLSEICLDCSCC